MLLFLSSIAQMFMKCVECVSIVIVGLLSLLMEQLDVFISIKPKPKQTTKVGYLGASLFL